MVHVELGAPLEVVPVEDTEHPAEPALSDLLDGAESRALAVEAESRDIEQFYHAEFEPLVRDLVWLGGDSTHAKRIATALLREGRRADLDTRLLLAVMRVENPWLDLDVLSSAGAVGLMQVMPFHAGAWGCDGNDLTDLDVNICHGTRILAWLLDRYDGDVERALLAYNGCVVGVSTTNCHLYPSWVLAHAIPSWADAGASSLMASNAPARNLVD